MIIKNSCLKKCVVLAFNVIIECTRRLKQPVRNDSELLDFLAAANARHELQQTFFERYFTEFVEGPGKLSV